MKHALELKGVSRAYGSFTALHPTNLTVQAGEFLTLLGPSGSGKTTLLMALAGFVPPSSGSMLVDGVDITALPPERRNFGVVFQGYALFPHLSVRDNIAFPLRARGQKDAAARARIDAVLELIQLGRLADRKPSQLSGGQQQRVALARALVFQPDLLLLDEPLSALDKALRKDLQAEIKDLHRRVGVTFVHVTHDQEEALAMSDRVAILKDGAIQQIDTPRNLYERPSSRFVAGFLGKSNFLPGQIVETRGEQQRIAGPVLDSWIRVSERLPIGAQVVAALRPEHLTLTTAPMASDALNCVQGKVVDVAYLGSTMEIDVDVSRNGDVLRLSTCLASSEAGAPRPGDGVWLSWRSEAAILLPDELRNTAS